MAKEAPIYVPTSKLTEFKSDYIKILTTQSQTGNCGAMMEAIQTEVAKIKGVKLEKDAYGNFYATKGKLGKDDKYPAFACHTDTVHNIYDSYTVARTEKGHFYAYSEDSGYRQVGVGGDDKCGIILCLELLHRLKYVKCAFYLDEEKGCKGSNASLLEFYDDCRYVIQIDRRGNSDIITTGSGTQLCSEDFKSLLNTIGAHYGYESTTGMNTDVVVLKERGLGISACNLSAGYYNFHTKQEFINERDLLTCFEFCVAIARIKTVYPHKYEKTTYTYNSSSSYNSSRSGYIGKGYSTPSPSVNRKCLHCNQTIYIGVICRSCVVSSLTVKEDDQGNKTLVADVKKRCQHCNLELQCETEKLVGTCIVCQFCSECGIALHGSELRRNACSKCDEGECCSAPDCVATLTSNLEKEYGACEDCIRKDAQYSTDVCGGVSCGGLLSFDDEIENGLCRDCMTMYGV